MGSVQTQEGISEDGPFVDETGGHPGTSLQAAWGATCPLPVSWSLGWYRVASRAGSTSHCSEGTDQIVTPGALGWLRDGGNQGALSPTPHPMGVLSSRRSPWPLLWLWWLLALVSQREPRSPSTHSALPLPTLPSHSHYHQHCCSVDKSLLDRRWHFHLRGISAQMTGGDQAGPGRAACGPGSSGEASSYPRWLQA